MTTAVVATPAAGAATGSSLTVRPARGPVGTSVTVSGIGCAGSSETVALEFRGVPEAGTRGSVSLLDIKPDGQGRFTVAFVVPPTMGQVQSEAGGPTAPGRYQFASPVSGCMATFTVTAGTARPLPATGRGSAWLALLAIGLLVLGAAGRTAGGGRRELDTGR